MITKNRYSIQGLLLQYQRRENLKEVQFEGIIFLKVKVKYMSAA